MHLSNDINHLQQGKQYIARAVLAVMLLLLTVQFFDSRFHEHAISESTADCVSCNFLQQLSSDLPPTSATLASVFLLTGYFVLKMALPQQSLPQASYMLPPAHAPPHSSSLQ